MPYMDEMQWPGFECDPFPRVFPCSFYFSFPVYPSLLMKDPKNIKTLTCPPFSMCDNRSDRVGSSE